MSVHEEADPLREVKAAFAAGDPVQYLTDGEWADNTCLSFDGDPSRYRIKPAVNDPVNHPQHYTTGGVECIDGIRAALTDEQFAGFCRGNAMKYIWRAGRKGDATEDLDKAIWYLEKMKVVK